MCAVFSVIYVEWDVCSFKCSVGSAKCSNGTLFHVMCLVFIVMLCIVVGIKAVCSIEWDMCSVKCSVGSVKCSV